jgi:hypothetical protein
VGKLGFADMFGGKDFSLLLRGDVFLLGAGVGDEGEGVGDEEVSFVLRVGFDTDGLRIGAGEMVKVDDPEEYSVVVSEVSDEESTTLETSSSIKNKSVSSKSPSPSLLIDGSINAGLAAC